MAYIKFGQSAIENQLNVMQLCNRRGKNPRRKGIFKIVRYKNLNS